MSWKKLSCVAAMSALLATPALAQSPVLAVKDAGVGSSGRIFQFLVSADPAFYTLDVDPTDGTMDSSGVAVELGISVLDGASIVSATTTADWQDDNDGTLSNPGDNPFTVTETEGIVTQPNNTDLFASLGSTGDIADLTLGAIADNSLVLTLEIDKPIARIGVGTDNSAGVASILAQDGETSNVSGIFSIFGDFNLDGRVSDGDFGFFAGQFGVVGDPGNAADFNGDGNVSDGDFGAFAARFGLDIANNSLTAGASAAPEPSSIALVLFGFAGLRFGSSRRR